jgi:ATP adenylyltransferase
VKIDPSPRVPTRFGWILKGESHGPDKAFDEDLAGYTDAAVIPTRGAIVPDWLLIVPRVPCSSFADLDAGSRRRILTIANRVSGQISPTDTAVMFEHGARQAGSASGCGVDQAHLHVVGGEANLLSRIIAHVKELEWSVIDSADPWSDLPYNIDYLVVRSRERAMRALVHHPTSQRLRRALASALNRGDEWDYRAHPNALNANRTIEMFRGVF